MIKMLLAGLGTVGPYSEKLSMTAGLKMLPSAAQFFTIGTHQPANKKLTVNCFESAYARDEIDTLGVSVLFTRVLRKYSFYF